MDGQHSWSRPVGPGLVGVWGVGVVLLVLAQTLLPSEGLLTVALLVLAVAVAWSVRALGRARAADLELERLAQQDPDDA